MLLLSALLQTSLLLCWARQTLQGGVRPQSVSWGRVLPARGVGGGVKPGVHVPVAGALGALGSRYGSKALKNGVGRQSGAYLGAGGYRAAGLGARAAGLGSQGAYAGAGLQGAGLGAGLGAGHGAGLGAGHGGGHGAGLGTGLPNGLNLGLGQQGKRVFAGGLGALPGYGGLAGVGYPVPRPGLPAGAGSYGAALGAGNYGAGLGQGGYLGAGAGKLGAAAALGQGGYHHQGGAGISPGYGDGAAGYLGPAAGNGYGADAAKALSTGYGNGYNDGYAAGLGFPADLADAAEGKALKRKALGTAGGYAGQVNGPYGALAAAGRDQSAAKYGGAAQAPFGSAPVLPAGAEGDGGFPFAPQQLALNAEGAKTASKFGAAERFRSQQTGFASQLAANQEALGEQAGEYAGDALAYKG
ncbi:uncharacterized protein LOC142898493 isoform X3 [Nelusetta ayraudi]